DEFHERHLPTDLGLALLRRLRERRPGLRLAVMSATFDPAPVARFLGDAPVLTAEGRAFPVEIEHLPAARRTRAPSTPSGTASGCSRSMETFPRTPRTARYDRRRTGS